MLIMANPTEIENDNAHDNHSFYLSNVFSSVRSQAIPINGRLSSLSHPINEHQSYRLNIHVDGFQPEELNITIRHGRLIVRGRHMARAAANMHASHTLSMSTAIVSDIDNIDTEYDFVAREFKRTFILPTNVDIRTAHAGYYADQQLLLIEIPFENQHVASYTTRLVSRRRIRPIDAFLTVLTILLMERALRITYEQFLLYETRQQHLSV
jgi:HSP20 family molecular chaperone IbpA